MEDLIQDLDEEDDAHQEMIPDVEEAPRPRSGRKRISDATLLRIQEFVNAPSRTKAAPMAQPKPPKPLGLMGTIKEGAKGTLRALGATADTMQGDAQGVVQAAQEQSAAPKDPDLARFHAHIEERKQQLGEDPSLWEGIKAVGGAAIDNPRGFGLMIAEQLPNSAAALGAGAAGAAAGSLAGPVGTIVGGLAGLAGANIGLETGAKALEAAADGDFPSSEQSRVLEEGAVKGGVVSLVDAGTLGVTKFITNTTRRAVERATVKTLADNGVDVTNAAARRAAMETPEIADAVKAAQELAKEGADKLGKRLATTGGAVALETIGEGAGEYLGELAATGKANAVDAVVEGFAGLGTSIGEIAATGALNRKGLNRLLDTQEEAEKTAEKETEETGVEHEAIPHPKEPEKFVAVPKARSVSGIELERDEEGNLKPVAPVSTQADFNLANRPGFEHTAEDKIRERELEKTRSPIIVPGAKPETPTIAGKPAGDMSNSALIYTVNRGSARAQKIATDELAKREKGETDPAIANAPEKPADTVKRIVATGEEKAQEDGKKAGAILTPTPTENTATAPQSAQTSNLQVVLPDNTSLPAQWDVVDADEIKATIKEGKNQPRDRSRAASDIQVQGIANNPDYRRLADSPVMDVGAPTLSHDGFIVGGNGRFEGVSRAYEQGSAKEYLANLKADAAAKGIDPAKLETMKKPVLVRRITQPFDIRKLAIASNSGTGLQYSGLELAKIDAERMQSLENLEITDSGDIAITGSNIPNIRHALSGYSAAELGSLVDKDGRLSQEGVRRIRNAMLYAAYGSNPTLERLVESTDNDLRNITGALIRAAGSAAKARAEINAGRLPAELDISEQIVGAVETLSKIRAQGQNIDEYLSQTGLFGEEINEETRAILRVLDANIRSQKKIADFIRTYYDAVSHIDTSTDDIFGAPTPTKPELLKNAKERITEKQPDTKDLFAKGNSGTGTESPKQPSDNASPPNSGQKDQQVKKEAEPPKAPKPEPKPEPKAEPKKPDSASAPSIRQHLDDLIKRRAASKETGKERSVNNAIARAKEVMEGKRTDTALESKWFRVQAAAVRKVDPATAEILSKISEEIKAKPAFSRSKTTKPKSLERKNVESVVKDITSKWKNAPNVVIVDDMNDPVIPESVRAENQRQLSQGATGEPEGFIADGKVYVVASQMKTPADVVRVLLHESLGHFGLRGVFGQELNTVLKQVAALRRSDIEAKAKQYGLDVTKEADRLIAAEEMLAEMAQANPKNSLVQRAFIAIRAWLRNNIPGFENLSLSDAEIIEHILVPAREFVQSGRGAPVGGNVAFFRSLRTREETLEKYGLEPKKRHKTRDVAGALEARQREKHGIIGRKDRSDKSAKAIAEWMAEEVRFEMQHPKKSGVGWYSEKFQRALDVMAKEFPEVATDKTARDALTVLIAITSDGQKVVPNFAMAMDLYSNFRATGKFTTTRGHARQASINKNIDVIQKMYDSMGHEDMHAYLMEERTVSELKQFAKKSGIKFSSSYQAHIKLPMAAVLLGPKLGAFYANLMGSSGYLTMDRWWSRTFNRYRGTLLQSPTRDGLDRFKRLSGNPGMSDDEVLSGVIAPRNSYEAKGYKEGTEIEKAANTIYKAAFENIQDVPFNTSDRTFMLKAVALAQEELKKGGVNMSVADIQAVLWYYEKRLYGELGTRQTADVSYEEAANRVVSERTGVGRPEGRPVSKPGKGKSVNDGRGVGEDDYVGPSAEETPSQVRFSRSSSANPAANPLRERLDKITDSLIYNFQDRFKPLKDIQKRAGPVSEDADAALAEERYSGMVRARMDTFEEQMRDPLLKAIHDSKVAYEDVEAYLHALHAPSRNAAMREINPTEPELKAQIDALEKQRDSLSNDADVKRFLKERRDLRQAEADIEDGIADESLARMIKAELAQLRKIPNVKDYMEALDKLKALRLVKPFKGDNTALSGMSDKQAKDILDKADKNGTRKALDKVSSLIDSITARTRQIYVEGGLEKADAIDAWNNKYEHYVPLHRDEVSGNTMPKVGQGFNIRGKESKRATGSTKDVTNILAHVVAQHEAAIIRSEKARVDRALFQFAKTHPDPSLWTLDNAPMLRTVDPVSGFVVERVDPTYKNRPEVLTLKIDGEEHTITFNEQNQEAMRLAASMKNLSSQELGEVTQMVGKFTRFLATMNTTANPVFVARNFLRDLQTAFVNLSDTEVAAKKREVFSNIPNAIKGMWALSRGKGNSQWARYAKEFKAAGGQTGWMEHYKDIGTRADALKKELATMQPGKLNSGKRAFKSLRDVIEDANNAVENGARLSAYVTARKAGLSEGKAASLAKNLTVNFNARGAKSVELNAWYMFMNASIQGSARLIKALSNREVRKIVAGVIISGFVMDILARSMAGDDDEDGENDYDQLPEHTKAMNFVFMVDGQPVTIPMPYGYNFFASTGRKVSEMFFRENYSPVKSATDLAAVFLDAFSPTGQAGSALQYVAPTVADPFVQWAENRNFAGNPLRRDQNPFGVPKPEYQMSFKSTSAPAKWLAEALNNETGGNEVRPGFVNVNPAFFDFAVSSILGGAGRTFLQTASAPAKVAGDDDIQGREIPFVNIFVGARPEYQTERKYFEAAKEVELADKELKTYRQKGDMEMVRQIREEHKEALRLVEAAKTTKNILARLRKRELALDKEDPPNKAQLRKELEEKKREVMSRFNKRYREAVSAEN